MKEEKFKVIEFLRQLILYIDDNLDNFPKKDIELKKRIRNLSYDLLEIAYKANSAHGERIQYVDELIAKIKVMDFLINLCYEKKIINSKKYTKFGNKIDDILKYTIGWQKVIMNEENNKKQLKEEKEEISRAQVSQKNV